MRGKARDSATRCAKGWSTFAGARPFHAVLVRAGMFSLAGSALWSMLPVVVSQEMKRTSLGYGILLGCLGAGSVVGASVLAPLRSRYSVDRIVPVGITLFAIATTGLALLRTLPLTAAAMVLGGVAWITIMSSFNDVCADDASAVDAGAGAGILFAGVPRVAGAGQHGMGRNCEARRRARIVASGGRRDGGGARSGVGNEAGGGPCGCGGCGRGDGNGRINYEQRSGVSEIFLRQIDAVERTHRNVRDEVDAGADLGARLVERKRGGQSGAPPGGQRAAMDLVRCWRPGRPARPRLRGSPPSRVRMRCRVCGRPSYEAVALLAALPH